MLFGVALIGMSLRRLVPPPLMRNRGSAGARGDCKCVKEDGDDEDTSTVDDDSDGAVAVAATAAAAANANL